MPRAYHSAVINAPMDKVSAKCMTFDNLDWVGIPGLTCELTGGKSNTEVGCQRTITLPDKAKIIEIQTNRSLSCPLSYTYQIVSSPFSDTITRCREHTSYFGTLSLRPITGTNQTFAEWSASWESKTEKEGEEVKKGVIDGLFSGGLAALAKAFA